MEFDRLRGSLKPLFGLGRRDSVEKQLTIMLYAAIGANALYSVFHLLADDAYYRGPGIIYLYLLIFHVMLLPVLKRGYLNQAALALLFSSWAALTYHAWMAAGVRDTALTVYILIIMVSALITSWRVSISISLLSLLVLWVLAVSERLGSRVAGFSSPIAVAVELTIIFVLVLLFIFLIVDALRRSVEAVREGEERFGKIFQVSPAAISITSLHDGRLVEANGAYWKLTGFDPESSIGRTTVELMIWKNEADRRVFVEKLIERKSLHNPAYELVNERGEKRITAVFYELMDHGAEPAILSMFYDITEQITVQRALRRSEERFRRVFEVSPVAIVITTLDEGRIIDANAAYWQLSGHDPETSIGATTLELRPGLRPELREEFVRELLERRSIQHPSYDFVNDLGDKLKTIAFFELIDVEGQFAILSMFHDMTQQNRARDALRQSETRLRAMLEAVPDMILEILQDGTIVHFIPSANNEFNYLPEKMLGKTIAQVLPAIAEQTAFGIRRALDSGQVYAFEYLGSLDGDNKTFEARIMPAGPDRVLALVRDVSLNKWSESERENLIEELEQKNAELERFTYTVSHDLKSPLITIKGFLGFVREDAKAGDIVRLEKDIQRINDATEKMQQLLSDLLELSRVGRINNTPVHISTNELIAEVVELLHGRISAGKISVHIADDLPSMYGDRPRIFEVFQNLIDNAAKFMGDQPEPRIDIGVQGEFNGAPIFFVRDNGIGIAAQFKDRIFGLFDKLNAESEGTGIGLALVKRIVEFHGGRIWVESPVGMGTSFYFVLQTQPPPVI